MELERDIIEQLAYDEGYRAAQVEIQLKEERRAARAAKRRYERKYFFIQRVTGLALIVAGIVVPLLLDGDATASLLLIPCGVALAVTNKHVLQIMGQDGDI